MPVPAMKGARSIVVAVLSGTSTLAGCAVGATSVGGGGGAGGARGLGRRRRWRRRWWWRRRAGRPDRDRERLRARAARVGCGDRRGERAGGGRRSRDETVRRIDREPRRQSRRTEA